MDFDELSDKTKMLRAKDLITSRSTSELLTNMEASVQLSGHVPGTLRELLRKPVIVPISARVNFSINKSEQKCLTKNWLIMWTRNFII